MSSENYQMLAKTFSGLEEVLKEELITIGASDVEVVIRGVRFTGSKMILYKANFCCRTATRVLLIIGEYKVKNTNDLYQSVYKIDWSSIFDLSQSFAINSTVNSEAFNNSMFVSLKAKDAIVDQFRSKFNKRPSVNTENPDIRINVHASADELSVSLDSSGDSLHKRGYRFGQNEASMNEVLAAGILKIVGWNGQCDFYDTMCGSGTLPIEAALIARNIPPGIFRKEFAFEKWKDFDSELFEEVYNDDYEKPFEHKIFASDIADISIRVSEKNAQNAGVLKDIEFAAADFASFVPTTKNGMLLINPPYGERMRDRMIEPLYTMIGDQLKNSFAGFKAWVFSSSEEGFKKIGLRPSQKIPLYNGPLECSLRLFELYEGSRKEKNQFDRPRDNQRSDDRRSNFEDRKPRGEFKPRGEYKPRDGSKPRGEFKPRGEYKPRDDFKPRGEFKPRDNFKSRENSERRPPRTENLGNKEINELQKGENAQVFTRDWGSFVPRHTLENKPSDYNKDNETTDKRPKRTRIKKKD